jgi:class 3 adenylate cyclase
MTQALTVLVVDDEPDIVRYLEHVLHRLGYCTASAGDGGEAIEKALNDSPDLILLDPDAGGDINETSGDGFMAIFQDGDPVAHAARGVNAALMLLALTEALNQKERDHPLAIHVGINSGAALVGSTRFEGRRGTRWTFTASGIVTTLAARLASAAGDGELLAGPETVRRLGGRYRLERVGQERLKNITEAIEVHRIISPPSRR